MKFGELLYSYWSQLALILAIIGYFFQRFYELKLKKAENKHSFFQQNKINAIIKFLACYAKNEQLWKHLPYMRIIANELNAIEIDEMIFPLMNDLQSSKNELALFLDENHLLLFEEITESLDQLNALLQKFYFNPPYDKKNIEMNNEFFFLRNKLFKENKNRILEIGKMSRKMFNS